MKLSGNIDGEKGQKRLFIDKSVLSGQEPGGHILPPVHTIEGSPEASVGGASHVLKNQRHIIRSFRSRYNARRKWYHKFADGMTAFLGSIAFLIINTAWFILWVLWNNNLVPGLQPFDPYPYSFLTMVVSLEAIFLSVVVLISQNRQADIADLREEIDFNINVRAEQEITRILRMLDEIHDHLGLNPDDDEELLDMKKSVNIDEIEQQIAADYDTNP